MGLVLVSPENITIEKSLRLGFLATNNEAEYEVLLIGDVHEIYTIKYSHIYIFSLTFMLFCDLGNKGFTCKVRLGQLNQTNLNLAMMNLKKFNPIKFKSNWSKESKEICTKSKFNSD